MDYSTFCEVIDTKNSDIMLFLLIYLLESRPFTQRSLEEYCNRELTKTPLLSTSRHYVASPSLKSKFTPSLTISKTPLMQKKILENAGVNSKSNILSKYAGMGNKKIANPLDQYTKGSSEKKDKDVKVEPNRKNKVNLRSLEEENDDKPFQDKSKISKQEALIEEVDSDDEDDEVKYEGYLFKITETNKLKKLWFKLYNKDLYCNPLKSLQIKRRQRT
jgi:hypothetical protein